MLLSSGEYRRKRVLAGTREPKGGEKKMPGPVQETAAVKEKKPVKKKRIAEKTEAASPVKKAGKPVKVKPMLAEIAAEPFDDPEWIFEKKYDGYRALALIHNGKVELYSRKFNSFNADYPEVVAALKRIPHSVIIDGEVVAENAQGKDSFQLLQNRGNTPVKIRYYAFDLVYLNGYDLSQVPLVNRKTLLKKIVREQRSRIVLYSDFVRETGVAFYKQAIRENLEGIIAKAAKSPYRYHTRSREWLKIKIHQQQEAVIAGLTEPRGTREHFGSLLLAVRDHDEWKYIGHCGTGFTHEKLRELIALFRPYFTKESPFRERVIVNAPVQWIRPHFVCQVKFAEWTHEGLLRQPVFLGLRNDKKATEVKREKPIRHAGKSSNKKNTGASKKNA